MLTIDWAKIDKFYLVYITGLVLLVALFILTFRSIFSAYDFAYEINQSSLDSGLKINKQELDEAHSWAFKREPIKLNF